MSIDPKKFIFLAEGLIIKTNGTVFSIYESDFLGSKAWKASERSSANSPTMLCYCLSVSLISSIQVIGVQETFIELKRNQSTICQMLGLFPQHASSGCGVSAWSRLQWGFRFFFVLTCTVSMPWILTKPTLETPNTEGRGPRF